MSVSDAPSKIQINKRYIPRTKDSYYDWVEPQLNMMRYGAFLCRVAKDGFVVSTMLSEDWLESDYKLEKQMNMENK